MPNVDGGSLWELVERRAEATPDALAAVDEDGRTLTWAEAKAGAERAAAGPGPHGHRRRATSCRGSSPPGSSRSCSCSRWPGSARSRTRCCPIYRDREVGFITRQAKAKLLVVPSTWSGFDFEAMATGIAEQHAAPTAARHAGARGRQGPAAGRPVDAAPAARPVRGARSAGTSTRRAPRRTRRARSTPTARSWPAPSA